MTAHFTEDQIKQLAAPLDRKHVAQRSQAGRQLSYIEGWHALNEANRIFGFDGWSSETVEMKCVAEGERQSSQGRKLYTCTYTARCRVTVYAGNRVIVREGVGAGHGMDQDAGQAHEKAIKEAETDSRKRGLMTFGNPFGLALYDKTQANVADVSEQEALEAATNPGAGAEPANGNGVHAPAVGRTGGSIPPTGAKSSNSERATAAVVDPKKAALDKRASRLSRRDSQALFDLLKASLEFCESWDSLNAWAAENGSQSGKQDGMHDDHRRELLTIARGKHADFKRAAA